MLKFILNKILKNEKGFSLLELIIVVSIMGILASQVMPVINSSDSARVVAHKTNMTYLRSAISRFEAEKISLSAFNAGSSHKYGPVDETHILVTEGFLEIDQFENPWKGTGATYEGYKYQIYSGPNNKAKITLAPDASVTIASGETTIGGDFIFYDKNEPTESAMTIDQYTGTDGKID